MGFDIRIILIIYALILSKRMLDRTQLIIIMGVYKCKTQLHNNMQ